MNMSFEGMSISELSSLSFFATTTSGSKLLEPLCDKIGLPIDKVYKLQKIILKIIFFNLIIFFLNLG